MSTYRFTARARLDLLHIWNHIASDNVTAARKMRGELFKSVRVLADNPGFGHPRDDVPDPRLRFYSVRPYVIAYLPETHPLTVVRIVHGARDFGAIFDNG